MVCKKDGTLCFCVGYRELTKKDTYPLLHVDDLLDNLASYN